MSKYFHKIDMSMIEAITSDIFDTILLRRGTSELSRLSDWSRIVSSGLEKQFSVDIPRLTLFETRRLIRRQAFRANEIYNPKLEVKYSQVVSIIVEMFALPNEALQLFELAEEEVEFRSLTPNTDLLKELGRLRNSGKKIYAITDTIMSASFVETLLHRVVDESFRARIPRCSIGDADRLVLVDTGLYGSTLRMIMEGYPEEQWESVLFARSNYKGISNPHFSRTTGLVVEQDHYSPVNSRSSILRYWHVIEALFEPDLASVRTYRRVDGQIVSNLEEPGWEDKIRQPDDLLLKGALRYLKSLSEAEIVLVSDRAQRSWRRLKSDILFPGRQALQFLDAGERSIDFGRSSKVSAVSEPKKHKKPLSSVKVALWREGHMAAHMEPFAKVYQIGWEMLYCGRFIKRALLSSCSNNKYWLFWPVAIILSSTCVALYLAEG